MEYSLPISQIVDATGADDTCLCSIKYQLCTCEVQPKANLEGEMRIFTVDAEIGAEATVHRKTQAVLSADCYCTGYDCSFQSAPVTLMTLIDTVREPHMFKGSVDMPNNIKGILNGWSTVTDQSVRFEKGILSVDFKLNLCLIAVDSEGAIQFYDKTEEVTHTISLKQSCEQVFFLPNLTPISMAYTMAGTTEPGGELDVRTEVMISGCIYCMLRQSAICEVVVDEQKPKPRDKNCALTIYYADKGESLWDIAKSYNTAIDLVMEENTLQPSTDPDLLSERTMLLIPMI